MQLSDADLACPARKKTMPTRLAAAPSAPPPTVLLPPSAGGETKVDLTLLQENMETVELTLTPCYVKPVDAELEKPEEAREYQSFVSDSTEDETEVVNMQGKEKDVEKDKEKVETDKCSKESGLRKEDILVNTEKRSEQSSAASLAKESRSVSLDSDLELSEEDSEAEDMEKKVAHKTGEEPSRPLARPSLFSDSDNDELSDDDRSHKRRCVDESRDEEESQIGGRDVVVEETGEPVEERSAKETAAEELPVSSVASPTKIDLTQRRYRNFLEELLASFIAEEKVKVKLLEEKKAALRKERQGYSYETFRGALRSNMNNLMGTQNQKSFETIVNSFGIMESDINKWAICDYIYSIFVVGLIYF